MNFWDRFVGRVAGNRQRNKFLLSLTLCTLFLGCIAMVLTLLASKNEERNKVLATPMTELSCLFCWIASLAQIGIIGFIIWRATTPITHTAGKDVTHFNLQMFGINVFRISWIRPQAARDGPAGPVAHPN